MRKKRILLIDDEPSFTNVLMLNLEDTGAYVVRARNNGMLGLVAVRDFKPDLIFLDFFMPDIGGGEVAFHIRNDRNMKDTPIVFLTAAVEKGKQSIIGGLPVLAKPVSIEEVIDSIEKNLWLSV